MIDRLAAARRGGLLRRFVAYSLGSVVAATTGELSFLAVYGWADAGTAAASVAGFIGGAVPNYVVNRRWVWGDRRGRARQAETKWYATVALCSLAVSLIATRVAQSIARDLTDDRSWQVFFVAAAYLAVAGMMFLAKFALFHLVVFTRDERA